MTVSRVVPEQVSIHTDSDVMYSTVWNSGRDYDDLLASTVSDMSTREFLDDPEHGLQTVIQAETLSDVVQWLAHAEEKLQNEVQTSHRELVGGFSQRMADVEVLLAGERARADRAEANLRCTRKQLEISEATLGTVRLDCARKMGEQEWKIQQLQHQLADLNCQLQSSAVTHKTTVNKLEAKLNDAEERAAASEQMLQSMAKKQQQKKTSNARSERGHHEHRRSFGSFYSNDNESVLSGSSLSSVSSIQSGQDEHYQNQSKHQRVKRRTSHQSQSAQGTQLVGHLARTSPRSVIRPGHLSTCLSVRALAHAGSETTFAPGKILAKEDALEGALGRASIWIGK